MGLDMNLLSKKSLDSKETKEIFYWRKHNALHNWFSDLYRSKGGEGEFNCVEVEITSADLDKLEKDLTEGNLIPVAGFFFGSTDYAPKENLERDLEAVKLAREAISNGEVVVYDSWW